MLISLKNSICAKWNFPVLSCFLTIEMHLPITSTRRVERTMTCHTLRPEISTRSTESTSGPVAAAKTVATIADSNFEHRIRNTIINSLHEICFCMRVI